MSGTVGRALARLWWRGTRAGMEAWAYYAIAYAVGILHLVEVHWLDSPAGSWAAVHVGEPFGPILPAEEFVAGAWDAVAVDAAVRSGTLYYLLGYIALLVWVPPLIASTGDRELLRRTLLAYPVLYLLALPFYLWAPIANPYTHLDLSAPFSAVHPDLEAWYYLLTTRDNTFPSLHVAFTAMLVLAVSASRLALLRGAAVVHGLVLAGLCLFLRLHWVVDVLAGAALGVLAFHLAGLCLRPAGALALLGARLERACMLGRGARARLLGRVERRWPFLIDSPAD